MRPHRPGSRTPILLLAAAALAATATVAARGTSASTPAGNAEVSEESKATLRLLWELREPLANVHGLPGGCPVEGRGVVAVAEAFAAAGLPHPERFDADGWGIRCGSGARETPGPRSAAVPTACPTRTTARCPTWRRPATT